VVQDSLSRPHRVRDIDDGRRLVVLVLDQLERFGGEPSTCVESAQTGLPQVTVPGGFVGGRYPVGVSFLGRMWTDRRMLALAYAYEQATHHRRPPPTVR
jgi:Asp-tRNA(Asn)/Glu-tRNA(Gln) amidotransferase A subunit family amidase